MSESMPTPEREHRPVTRVYIERTIPIIGVTEQGKMFVSARLQLHRRGHEPDDRLDINNFHNLSNIENLEIYIPDISTSKGRELGNDLHEIDLPTELLEKFAEYLRNIHEYSQSFDCSEFVHFLYNIKNTFKDMQPITDNWTLGTIERHAPPHKNSLKPGDVISFMRQSRDGKVSLDHFAIYLGQDVLLSQSGLGGKLIATDFSTTMQMYSATSWTKLTPKPDAPAWTPDDQS
jgi:hypothetical protein